MTTETKKINAENEFIDYFSMLLNGKMPHWRNGLGGSRNVIKSDRVTMGPKRKIPTSSIESSDPLIQINKGEDDLIKDIRIICSCGEEIILDFEYDDEAISDNRENEK